MAKKSKIKKLADGGSTNAADVKDSGGGLNLQDIMFGGLTRPIWETISTGNTGVPGVLKYIDQQINPKKKTGTPGATPPVSPTMRKGGAVKNYAKGGSVKSSASKRGDGIAQRGKTKGKLR